MSLVKISTVSPGLAPEYSSSSPYSKGDYVLWQNRYWRCTTPISAPGESWTAAHWAEDADGALSHFSHGKADLVGGKVPAVQLPSYVDDVLEFDAKDLSTVVVFRSDRNYQEGSVVKHGSPSAAYVFVQAHSAGEWTGTDVRDAVLFPGPGEGDVIYVAKNTNTQYRWSGSTYIEIANYVPPSGTVPLVDGTASAGTEESYARGDHRHPTDPSRASTADATLTARGPNHDGFSEWTILRDGVDVTSQVPTPPTFQELGSVWLVQDSHIAGDSVLQDMITGKTSAALSLSWSVQGPDDQVTYTSTRTALPGYTLGSQTNKVLASEAEVEELREKKYEKPSGGIPKTDLASGVQTSLGNADNALPKTSVVAPSTSASASGKAADAKATGDALEPLLFAQYYPDGSVKSTAEFTAGIKYDAPDTANRTITVKPFCNTGTASDDNSSLMGRVVIPPFVDAQYNPYISDDGTRFKVVGVAGASAAIINTQSALTAIVAPNTVTGMGVYKEFAKCSSLVSVSLPAATNIGDEAFADCTSLVSVSLPAATSIWDGAFDRCTSLASVSLPAATSIGNIAFAMCTSLESIDFGTTISSVPTLGSFAFDEAPTSCKFIVPDSLYDAWIAATNWSTLYADGYKFLKHSEWEYARKYELTAKQDALTAQQLANIAAVPNKADASDLRYAISESIPLTVTSGAAATTLADRTHNVRTVAAPGSGNTTTITVTLPPIVAGKSRYMFLNLTVGSAASDAGDISLSIVEPSGATVDVDFGGTSDVAVGKNMILLSEVEAPTTATENNAVVTHTHWLVTVHHNNFKTSTSGSAIKMM